MTAVPVAAISLLVMRKFAVKTVAGEPIEKPKKRFIRELF